MIPDPEDPSSSIPDRVYDAKDLNNLFDGLIAPGIFRSVYNRFEVKPSSPVGLSCIVSSGKAWVGPVASSPGNDSWIINSEDLPITTDEAGNAIPSVSGSSYSRIDMVFIKVDSANRTNSIQYRVGTQATSPMRPILNDNEWPIAYITISGSVNTITAGSIQNVVGLSRSMGGTPYIIGTVDSIDQDHTVDDLYSSWAGRFEEWFSTFEDNLSDDQAIHLQQEIDNLIQYGLTPLTSTSPSSITNGQVYFQYEV